MAGGKTVDIVVIGGGVVGAAVAYGLAGAGCSVAMLDEGDAAFRAARANFGLVWFQGKGLGMPRYVRWCLEATQKWPAFADALTDISGIRLDYIKSGGLSLCYGQDMVDRRAQHLQRLKEENPGLDDGCRMLDRRAVQGLAPELRLGEGISGASHSRHDGHVNPLALLKALHGGFQLLGGHYFPGHAVSDIRRNGNSFDVYTASDRFRADRVVIAAGNGAKRLARMVGLKVPIRPQRGQILVTERVQPVLPLATDTIRQTAEGSFLLGASHEWVGYDAHTSLPVMKDIAQNAIAAFPDFAGLRLVRCWGALRVLAPDEMPIYAASEQAPGAFVVTSHSGVSLAPLHAGPVSGWIAADRAPREFSAFGLERFDV